MKIKFFILSLVATGLLGLYGILISGPVLLVAAEEPALEDGTLLKVKGLKGAPVYEIGPDGKKYVFPDEKTFKTWHDDFKAVKEVSTKQLERIAEGGVVAVQPGSKLITHKDTNKVFVVGQGSTLYHIPDELTARKFYGYDWAKKVIDLDPGIFAVTYKNNNTQLSENNLPEGALVQEEGKDDLVIIEKNTKREVKPSAYGDNGLYRKLILKVKEIPKSYGQGEALKINEKNISNYAPVRNEDAVVICHDPDNSIGRRSTIKISRLALPVHLAHGDTEGACSVSTPPQPVPSEPVRCENLISQTKSPAGGKYWRSLGLNTSAQSNIIRYRILWSGEQWSPWYTPGVDDLDWVDPSRRAWAYFDDHSYQIELCQKINEYTSDVSCPNGVQAVLEVRPPTGNDYWENLLLNNAAHPEIKKYKIRWPSGAWDANWYYYGQDVDPDNPHRRRWSLFDDHQHKVVYCPNAVLDGRDTQGPTTTSQWFYRPLN